MWEILVPTVHSDGRPIKTRYHKVWDNQVVQITGGLTILPPTSKGKWVCPQGKLSEERMIPVRVVCTKEQINMIITMTLAYYDQTAVLAYKISDEVILRYVDVSD